MLGDLSGLNVLDYGCGPGILSRQFKEMGAKRIIGYDISKEMLNYARKLEKNSPLGINYIPYISLDEYQLFDVIIAIYPLACVSNYNEIGLIIKQFDQLLKSNGKLIAVILNTDMSDIPEYYSPYGINFTDIGPRNNGSIAQLVISHPLYYFSVPTYYWYVDKLSPLLEAANFHNIQKIELNAPPTEYLSELANYIACPHANIIYAHKK